MRMRNWLLRIVFLSCPFVAVVATVLSVAGGSGGQEQGRKERRRISHAARPHLPPSLPEAVIEGKRENQTFTHHPISSTVPLVLLEKCNQTLLNVSVSFGKQLRS